MTKKQENGQWVTIKGTHVFIRDGESVDEALIRQAEERKEVDIAKNRQQAEPLNQMQLDLQFFADSDDDDEEDFSDAVDYTLPKEDVPKPLIDTKLVSSLIAYKPQNMQTSNDCGAAIARIKKALFEFEVPIETERKLLKLMHELQDKWQTLAKAEYKGKV